MIKITRLTDFNVRALRELLTEAEMTRVTIGETVATFDMDVPQAQRLIVALQQRAAERNGTQLHPYKSLFAVKRKIDKQAGATR